MTFKGKAKLFYRKIFSKQSKSKTNLTLSMDNRKTGYETYVTWADFLSPIGCFVLQDGVAWFHHSGNL